MRDTKTLFDTFEDIKTLCQYLYMSEDHEILIHNMINVPLKIYMRDDLEIMCQNMNFPELEPMHLSDATPSKLCDIITCLKEEPALEVPDSFRNRWEEVEALTRMQLGLNEPNYTRMNYPQPTMSDGVSVMPLYGMNLQELLFLQNRACPLCPYPIGLPLGILFLRYLLLH